MVHAISPPKKERKKRKKEEIKSNKWTTMNKENKTVTWLSKIKTSLHWSGKHWTIVVYWITVGWLFFFFANLMLKDTPPWTAERSQLFLTIYTDVLTLMSHVVLPFLLFHVVQCSSEGKMLRRGQGTPCPWSLSERLMCIWGNCVVFLGWFQMHKASTEEDLYRKATVPNPASSYSTQQPKQFFFLKGQQFGFTWKEGDRARVYINTSHSPLVPPQAGGVEDA